MTITSPLQRLPDEIRAEPLIGGMRYILPPRQLGRLRLLGLIPLLIGLGMLGFGVSWIWTALQPTRSHGWPSDIPWTTLLFAAIGLVPLYVSRWPLLIGRNQAELAWVAAVLRKALRLPATPPKRP